MLPPWPDCANRWLTYPRNKKWKKSMKKRKSDGIIEHTKAKERKTTHNNTKEEKCGQFATSGLLHALTITLFRRPPSAYPSCSGLSLQLLLSFWVRAWKTNPKHSGLIWRCLWEEAKKDRTKGSNPPLSSEFMISILAMCIFFFSLFGKTRLILFYFRYIY